MIARGRLWKIIVIFMALATRLPAQFVKPPIAMVPLTRGVTEEEANALIQFSAQGHSSKGRSLTAAERILNGLVVVSASGAFVALNGYLNAPHTDVGLQWKRASVALGITAGVLLAVRTFVGLESPKAE